VNVSLGKPVKSLAKTTGVFHTAKIMPLYSAVAVLGAKSNRRYYSGSAARA
jgi:hypothetical protein